MVLLWCLVVFVLKFITVNISVVLESLSCDLYCQHTSVSSLCSLVLLKSQTTNKLTKKVNSVAIYVLSDKTCDCFSYKLGEGTPIA